MAEKFRNNAKLSVVSISSNHGPVIAEAKHVAQIAPSLGYSIPRRIKLPPKAGRQVTIKQIYTPKLFRK
jgi:hypothetical protein